MVALVADFQKSDWLSLRKKCGSVVNSRWWSSDLLHDAPNNGWEED